MKSLNKNPSYHLTILPSPLNSHLSFSFFLSLSLSLSIYIYIYLALSRSLSPSLSISSLSHSLSLILSSFSHSLSLFIYIFSLSLSLSLGVCLSLLSILYSSDYWLSSLYLSFFSSLICIKKGFHFFTSLYSQIWYQLRG